MCLSIYICSGETLFQIQRVHLCISSCVGLAICLWLWHFCVNGQHTQALVLLQNDSVTPVVEHRINQWWSLTIETSFHQTSLEEKPVAMGTRHWLVAVIPCSVGFTSVSHCIWALQKHYFPHPSMYRQVSSMVSLYKHTQNIVGGLTVMSEKC